MDIVHLKPLNYNWNEKIYPIIRFADMHIESD